MSNGIASLPRDVLFKSLGNDVRAVRAFEQEAQNNAVVADRLAANVDATDSINDATVITLSANQAFNNERVLKIGPGISVKDDGKFLTIAVDDTIPHLAGGFAAQMTVTQDTFVTLPTRGQIATTDQPESLANKTLAAPSFSDIGEYATDAAAAAGGVPVGGAYTTSGALKIRRV